MPRKARFVDGFKHGFITLITKVEGETTKWDAACDCGRKFQLYSSALANPLKVSCGKCDLKAEETQLSYVDGAGYMVTGKMLNDIIRTVPKGRREQVKILMIESCQLWREAR